MYGDHITDTRINRLATELWMECQDQAKQGWIDYGMLMHVRKPSNREVSGEIVGTYYRPPLDLVIEDVREAIRVM